MRLFTANGAHMSCTGSVPAWAYLDGPPAGGRAGTSVHPEGAVMSSASLSGTAEEVYYGSGDVGAHSCTSDTEKP